MRAGGLQTPACHACVTKISAKNVAAVTLRRKAPEILSRPCDKRGNFVEIAKRQIMMVKMAVDSGMCIVPTEHCIRMQTLPCRI